MARSSDERAIVATRLAAQLLAGPAAISPEAVVERVLAVQGQDARGFRLAVRARSTGLAASDVNHALTDTRSLIVTTLNRGTLHLVAADDYWWLHRLTTPQLATGNRRRLEQEGVSTRQTERGVDVIVGAVTTEGAQTREQLRARLDDAGVPTAGQALVHLLAEANLRGHVVRGPMVGRNHAFVSVPQWLGRAPEPMERSDALALLARRYLAGHGPASARDLAQWAGITLGDARLGFAALVDQTIPWTGERSELVLLSSAERATSVPAPRLLGAFDPLLHGWQSRELVVGAHSGVVTKNGMFHPSALVNGRVIAVWSAPRGVVTITELEPIPLRARTALAVDADAVLQYLGLAARPAVFA